MAAVDSHQCANMHIICRLVLTVVNVPAVSLQRHRLLTHIFVALLVLDFVVLVTIADSGHQRPHCSENKHSTWRREFLGRRSENLDTLNDF